MVSVICSTYNRKATLNLALRSVLNQTLKNFEALVIGDGCTDGSQDAVDALNDPRFTWLNLPSNTGSQTEPNNEGLRRARGRYVAFIGHDDLWFPWHLERLVAQSEKSGADLLHDLAASIGPHGVDGAHGPPIPQSGYARTYVPTSSWLHRRELPNEIGLWRDPHQLSWAIDYDFSRRAALAGKKLEYVDSLGVLKFHSAVWKLYSRAGAPPGQEWWAAMQESPGALSEKILTQLAAQYAQRSHLLERPPFSLAWTEAKTAARCAIKAGVRGLIHLYGQERWPVGPILLYRARRLRAQFRAIRGLEPTNPNGQIRRM